MQKIAQKNDDAQKASSFFVSKAKNYSASATTVKGTLTVTSLCNLTVAS